MNRSLARSLVIAALALLGCPKPIDPPQTIDPASTTSEVDELEPPPGPCTYDDDCPRAEICDGGECLHEPEPASATAACGVPVIHFARGSARLSPNNQIRLTDALACVRELGPIELAACFEHDEDPELAARRAGSVIGLLTSLGVAGEGLRVVACPTSSGRHVELRRTN